MAMRLDCVTIDSWDPSALGAWWADVLGWRYEVDDDGDIVVERDDDSGTFHPALLFQRVPDPDAGRIRIHLDLGTESLEHQQRWVDELLAKGATHCDVGQKADAAFVVLADPEGNPFCVLDPRPEYAEPGTIASIVLAAHDHTAIAPVWHAALGWEPFDIGDDEAISWRRPGGRGPTFDVITRPTMPREEGKDRIHIDVAPSADEDQDEVVARLEALGATRVDIGQGDTSWVVLADPEGNELCVLRPRAWD